MKTRPKAEDIRQTDLTAGQFQALVNRLRTGSDYLWDLASGIRLEGAVLRGEHDRLRRPDDPLWHAGTRLFDMSNKLKHESIELRIEADSLKIGGATPTAIITEELEP